MNKSFLNFLFVTGALLFFSNCAKRGTPSGGPLDSIPPVIVKSNPENYTINFSEEEIRIYFDEYIKLKNLQQNLIISPPLKYQPEITPLSTSKVLKIKILDTLKENTTYSINFGESIVDNNEENPFEYFKYVFSTGSYIDSLNLTGNLKHSLYPKLDGKAKVMLYEINEAFNDSLVFNEKPTYITVTKDSTGNFELTNLKAGQYKLIALKENSNDFTFQPQRDEIGFIENEINIPTDSSFKLKLFKEIPDYKATRPSLVSKNEILFGYEGSIDSLIIKPLSLPSADYEDRWFKDLQKDTIHYWFKPPINPEELDTVYYTVKHPSIIDTLPVRIRELYADSLKLTKLGAATLLPMDSLELSANIPITTIDSSKIKVMNQDSVYLSPTISYDRLFNKVKIYFDKQEEEQFNITVNKEALTDFIGNVNDSIVYKVKTNASSDYGTLSLNIQNAKQYPILVELVNDKYKIVASSYLRENSQVNFEYLEPSLYYLRIIYDENENGIWDTGNYLKKQQPEEVVYYPTTIEVRANWSLNETFILK